MLFFFPFFNIQVFPPLGINTKATALKLPWHKCNIGDHKQSKQKSTATKCTLKSS